MVPQNEKYCIFLVHIVGSVLDEFRFAVHHLNNTNLFKLVSSIYELSFWEGPRHEWGHEGRTTKVENLSRK